VKTADRPLAGLHLLLRFVVCLQLLLERFFENFLGFFVYFFI
jgi:hypothetical protein